jgi:hypothetical protein
MAVTGGIKFFYKNYADIDNASCLVSCSTGSALRGSLRDRKTYTRWESSGSSDATTETITVDFGASHAINRLILVKNNFKAFSVTYWNGSAWTDFSTVVTKEGSQAKVEETTNAKTTNYYEFTEVTTDKIKITVTTTQTANAEKYVGEVIATKEIGTMTGYPNQSQTFEKIQVKKETLGGKPKFSILDESYSTTLDFSNYPTTEDHALIQTLWEGNEEFLIYPCGGNTAQFRFPRKGTRLEDVFLVWFDSDFSPNFTSNVYSLGMNYQIKLVEVA